MPVTARLIAAGGGWRVTDLVCDAGPRQRPFEEMHDEVCIALVTRGTFQYRTAQGSAMMTPGALLLGNCNRCYVCSHEHGVGDRCLAFHYTPEFFENIRGGVRLSRADFPVPALPPLARLSALLAEIEADCSEPLRMEEAAVRLAGAVAHMTSNAPLSGRRTISRDIKRITAAVRWIEANALEGAPALADIARMARMSIYHFLRIFREVVGLTPYQVRAAPAAASCRGSAADDR